MRFLSTVRLQLCLWEDRSDPRTRSERGLSTLGPAVKVDDGLGVRNCGSRPAFGVIFPVSDTRMRVRDG